jgi:hypothetical protein
MRKLVLALSVSLIMVIGIMVLVECGGGNGNPHPTSGKIALPSPTLRQPAGEPAIKPTINGVPAFSKLDVINYITTHPMLFTNTPDSTIKVGENDIAFITSKEVNRFINRQNTGIPDNYLLCFALLTGPFTFSGPPTDKGQSSTGTYAQAYEVFDATTGNLLMGGALAQPSRPIG